MHTRPNLAPPRPDAQPKGGQRYQLELLANQLLQASSLDGAAIEKLADLERGAKALNVPIRRLLKIPENSDESITQYLEKHFRRKTFGRTDFHREMAARFAAHIQHALATESELKKVEDWIKFQRENSMPGILPSYKDNKEIIDAWLAIPNYDKKVQPLFTWLRLLSGLLAEYGWGYEDVGMKLPNAALEVLVRAAYTALHKKNSKGRASAQEQKVLNEAYPLLEDLKSAGTWVNPMTVGALMKAL